MGIVSKLAVAALSALFIAQTVPQASAQDAARDAAIHKCIIEVQKRFPDASIAAEQSARLATYRSCMAAAGQAP
jgi:hypothetical protein